MDVCSSARERVSAPARATESPISVTAILTTAVLLIPAPVQPAASPEAHDTITDVRPAATPRAGRDYFRIQRAPIGEVQRGIVAAPVVAPAEPPVKPRAPKAVKPKAPKRPSAPKPSTPYVAPAPGSIAVVIQFAMAQVGKRYVWGAAGPSAYDCSGLIMAAFLRAGVHLPHQSGAIARRGRAVPQGQWQPGDAIIMPGHVALYIGNGLMVEAANPRAGVRIAKVRGGYARRLL